MVTFRHGVKPNDPRRPRLYFAAFRNPTATPPASVNYYSQVTSIGMLGNDNWGDCVEAGDGHIIEQQTKVGQGTEVVVTDAQVLNAYSAITGFDPNAGPPGSNPTDQGTEIQAGLDYLRRTGLAGHKITAFAQLDPTNMTDVRVAVSEFGCISIGLAFPSSAMDQFNNGQPWDVVPGSPIEGGHCVIIAGYDATYLYLYTWGAVQRMTYAFWNEYVAGNGGEAWAVISQDWINASTGKDVEGVDAPTFGAQFAALTGQPNPFPAPVPPVPPAPTPPPTPVPPAPVPPGPVPTPPLDPAEQALVVAARRFLSAWYPKPKYLAMALKHWLSDKDE
jgi:hypothetical protein